MRFGTAAGQRTNFADNLPGTATAAFAPHPGEWRCSSRGSTTEFFGLMPTEMFHCYITTSEALREELERVSAHQSTTLICRVPMCSMSQGGRSSRPNPKKSISRPLLALQ
jgi:hypothetical protein